MGVGLITAVLNLHFTELSSLQTFPTFILPCSSLRAYLSVSQGRLLWALALLMSFVSGCFHYVLFPLLWLQSSQVKAPSRASALVSCFQIRPALL